MNKAINGIKDHWFIISLLTIISITILSLYPLDNLPEVPGTDKTHHFIAYAALSFPTALRKPNRWIYYILFFVFYGGLIELIQPYVNRYGEWLDMLANTGGVVCGVILATMITTITTNQSVENKNQNQH